MYMGSPSAATARAPSRPESPSPPPAPRRRRTERALCTCSGSRWAPPAGAFHSHSPPPSARQQTRTWPLASPASEWAHRPFSLRFTSHARSHPSSLLPGAARLTVAAAASSRTPRSPSCTRSAVGARPTASRRRGASSGRTRPAACSFPPS